MTVSRRGVVAERRNEGDETEQERLLRLMIIREGGGEERRDEVRP